MTIIISAAAELVNENEAPLCADGLLISNDTTFTVAAQPMLGDVDSSVTSTLVDVIVTIQFH